MSSTSWYVFVGTGERVVVRLDGATMGTGLAVYLGASPAEGSRLSCVHYKPQRTEIETEAGRLYWIQVGASSEDVSPYWLSLFPKTVYGERIHPFDAQLGTTFEIGSWGAPPENPPPWCPADTYGESGDRRSAWARVDIPAPGTLHVNMRPVQEELNSWNWWMIILHSADEDFSRCAFGGSSPGVELSEYVSPGPYWIQLTRAFNVRMDEEVSIEESWKVHTDFEADLDVDRDGYNRPSDCDDSQASIHPKADEALDNGIDEDCNGADAKFDTDQDLVPDFRDKCPDQPSQGIDSNYDGCRDPGSLQLVAQVRLTLNGENLHVASLFVRTAPGATVVLTCDHGACEKLAKKVHRRRTRFDATFDHAISEGTVVTITAAKPMHLTLSKRYRLSRQGVRLLRERCMEPGGPIVPCG